MGFVCKNCGKEFKSAEFEYFYNICDDCKHKLRDFFPLDDDECPICGNTIKYVGSCGYESLYKCPECGSEWWYD